MPAGDDSVIHDPEPGGDFAAEISDMRPAPPPHQPSLHSAASDHAPDAVGASSGRPPGRDMLPTSSPFATRRTPHQRLLRQAGIAATVLLALVIVTSGIPALREYMVNSLLPAPAPTIAPGSNLFTLLPNPPGVTVSLDGHPLAHPPAPGDPHPLRLAPGRHIFAWQSRLYPFIPQSCTISVPAAPANTCAFVAPDVLDAQAVLAHSNVLAMHPSLFTLQASDIASLQQTLRRSLANSETSAIIHPGEPYYTLADSGADSSTVAAQPLQATLSFAFDTVSGNTDPCMLRRPDFPCRFQGQNCIDLCTILNPPASVTAGTPNAWIAAAVVSTAWTYTAPDGHILGSYPDVGIIKLVVMRITWDGAAWQVTPLFGHTPGLDATDDIACDPARYWLANSTWNFMLADPPPGAQAQFYSDANPAGGCLVVMERGQPAAQTARFLERFGLLFTLNDAARNPLDNFPQAGAAAQAQARAIAAKAGVNLWSASP